MGRPRSSTARGSPRALQHLLLSHTDVNQLGALAELAAAERLVLTYLVPADPKLMSDGRGARTPSVATAAGSSWATT
ncbi:MAG: hypothetical protein U0R78_05305 [Nocardioidaceae bacterium]